MGAAASPAIPATFGQLLEAENLSIRAAASLFELGHSQVGNLVTGKHGTTIDTASMIARKLRKPVALVLSCVAESRRLYLRRQKRLTLARK